MAIRQIIDVFIDINHQILYVGKNITFTDAVVASSATKKHIEYLASLIYGDIGAFFS